MGENKFQGEIKYLQNNMVCFYRKKSTRREGRQAEWQSTIYYTSFKNNVAFVLLGLEKRGGVLGSEKREKEGGIRKAKAMSDFKFSQRSLLIRVGMESLVYLLLRRENPCATRQAGREEYVKPLKRAARRGGVSQL